MAKNTIKVNKTELVHEVIVKSFDNEKVTIEINMGDVLQLDTITEIFEKFDSYKDITIEAGELVAWDDIRAVTRKIATTQREIYSLLDLAFGDDLRVKALKGSNDITVFIDFLNDLANQIELAGVKIQDYGKKVRREHAIKKPDTAGVI